MKKSLFLMMHLSLLILTGCVSNKAIDQESIQYSDPLETVNRSIWDFNYEVLDAFVLRPSAVAYVEYMPQAARTGLLNMAENLEEPSNSINNLLQGKVADSVSSLGRFVLNSTVGLLGVIDVASEIGLERKEEAFGEVLGSWGLETGPYLMLPALGPSDVRSGVGDYVDNFYGPLDALNIYFSIFRMSIKALDARGSVIQQEQQLHASADPYSFVKNAYFQNLEFKVKDGKIEKSAEEQQQDEEIDAYLNNL
ncbi:MAG: VacJ family lipoprotein [Paraglaciecola sp.]|uniref:MlaA family lipoprotein n=1 Tax=Paraglaciecola sp. TaxID=1920173 RepID=UPI00273FE297|nr:VacJ family lipoprotein [Paraglaciecola sp.]MDP5029183.1 VacJ family lipoprotein [Paraglaciecola sp.]MDP5129364.1 VacJ family lipoprotein [Paraglaciecola sp.]